MRALEEKNLYIKSLEKKNDSSKNLIQDLLQLKKLYTCFLPHSSELDHAVKAKIQNQLEKYKKKMFRNFE